MNYTQIDIVYTKVVELIIQKIPIVVFVYMEIVTLLKER